MNYSSIKKAARLIMAAAGLLTAGTTSWGAEFWLRAGTTTNTLPDGRQVVMWGFALDSADGAGDGVITVPGPQLNVAANDTLILHLQNTLPEPVSIVVPGQFNYQVLDPVFHSGGTYDGRVRSMTHEAAPLGGKATYVWTSVQPGSFLYHSASHPSVQVQMGLYGALTVVAPGPAVYAGVPFNSSVTLLCSEIDPDVHDAVAGGSFGPGPSFFDSDFTNAADLIAQINASTNSVAMLVAAVATNGPDALASDLNGMIGGPSIYAPTLFPDAILSAPTLQLLMQTPPPSQNYPISGIPFNGNLVRMNRLLLQDGLASAGIALPLVNQMTSTIRSHAQYFLINGQAYTNGLPPIYAGRAGSTILLRLLNAGMDAHVPTLNNAGDVKLIGEDGQQAPYVRTAAAVFMPAFKTVDALWTPATSGTNAVYDRRLGLVNGVQSPGGMLAYLAVSASNVVAAAPTILLPPANDIAFIGQSAVFSVIASHVGPLTYQWRLNGANVGPNAATYTIAAVAAANRGNYTVVVTEGALSTTSAVATLTVVTQPAPVTVADGAAATFSVTNLGPAVITYQWQKDGVDIGGATNSSYTFNANYSTDNGHLYRVVVNGPGGPATSSAVALTVTAIAPAIVTQPTNQNVPDFTTATFSVVATGSALTYQWRRDSNLVGNNFAVLNGATNASYSRAVTRATDNNTRYRVVVSGPGGPSVTSGIATVTVFAVGAQILTQPSNTVANYGQPTNLTVVAQATGGLSYQWQKQTGPATWVSVNGGGGVSGSTSATLAFNGAATANLANQGTYRVIVNAAAVANPGGIGATSVTGAPALFTIGVTQPTITAQPANIVTTAGVAQVQFTVGAFGFPVPAYQWQRFDGSTWVNLTNGNGATAVFSGVTTPTLTVAAGNQVSITVAHAGSYRVNLTNIGGAASATGTLTVVQTFNGTAINTIPSAGGNATLYPATAPSGNATVPAFTGSSVKHVTVSLTLTHPEPFDVNALLTTPTPALARKVQFMGGISPYQQPFETPPPGGLYSYPVTNVVLTFDDAAPTPAPTLYPLYSGTFQPTVRTPTNFPPVVPPYGTNFVTFTGFTQPSSGDWRLYVVDVAQDIPLDASAPNGRISSWSFTLTVGP